MIQIIISVISGLLTLAGVCVTAWCGSRRTAGELATRLDVAQAVTDAKLTELTREVREHNNFARRMPVVEEQIRNLQHRLGSVEREESV